MATLYLPVRLYVSIMTLIESSSAICGGHLRLTGPGMAAMINRTYPLCRDVDLRYESPICELSEDDVSDTCSSSAQALPPLPVCEDGTWNRTCYPVSTRDVNYHMSCVCHSAVHIPDDVRATYWSGLEELSPPVGGAFYTRRLMMEGGECITQEIIKMEPVVARYDLPDSVYTASTSRNSQLLPYRAHIDDYLTGSACGWVPRADDIEKWLGITLPKQYAIKGCVITRCGGNPHATIVTVTTSDDDLIWRNVTVGENISVMYNSDDAAFIWFSTSYTSRYWKILIVSQTSGDPRVKADLIGVRP